MWAWKSSASPDFHSLSLQQPPAVEEPPKQEEGVFHQDNTQVWSPEMVESRMSTEAKSAVELLHELNQLKNEGAITEDEYQIHKKRMLRKI